MSGHPFTVMTNSLNENHIEDNLAGHQYPVIPPEESSPISSTKTTSTTTTNLMIAPAITVGGLSSYPTTSVMHCPPNYTYNVPNLSNIVPNVGSSNFDNSNNTTVVQKVHQIPNTDGSVPDNKIPELKTPADYALNILYRQFYKSADKKLSKIMNFGVVSEVKLHVPSFLLYKIKKRKT